MFKNYSTEKRHGTESKEAGTHQGVQTQVHSCRASQALAKRWLMLDFPKPYIIDVARAGRPSLSTSKRCRKSAPAYT
jgi:hypothetical protein